MHLLFWYVDYFLFFFDSGLCSQFAFLSVLEESDSGKEPEAQQGKHDTYWIGNGRTQLESFWSHEDIGHAHTRHECGRNGCCPGILLVSV